jgi:hypothetical protein
VASYAGPVVTGIQGKVGSPDFMTPGHVIATSKHFVGDGGTGGRDQGDTKVSEVVLRDVHAAGYPPAIEDRACAPRRRGTAYQRYQLDWRHDSITIGVDDIAYMCVANDRPGGADAWPFTRPYDLILNLAIGGDWGGVKGIDDAVLPQRMRIDYVRYWKPDRRVR